MKQIPRLFEDSVQEVRGHTVLLDVDGTLLPDGTAEIDDAVRDAALQLHQENMVYLVSNGNDANRVVRLANDLGVNIAPAGVPAGKPSARAAHGISSERPFLVIGDKFITDGLFARVLGVPFLRVRSKRSGTERFSVRISYMLESVVSWFL